MSAPQLTKYQQGVTVGSADGFNTFQQSCDTFSQLRSFSGTQGMQVYARGRSAAGDGYQGDFYWKPTLTGVSDDNLNYIIPDGVTLGGWVRLLINYSTTIPTFTSVASGLVPASGGAAGTYLNAGGTFTTPPDTQGPSLVSSFRKLTGSAAGSTSTATWYFDQFIVQTAVSGGVAYEASYPASGSGITFNGSTIGAGGMDAGTLPTSGTVHCYLIYNPTTVTWSTLGTIVGSGNSVYTGSSIPSGYTASGLMSSVLTDGSAKIVSFVQNGAKVFLGSSVNVLNMTSGAPTSYTSFSLASAAPVNATTFSGVAGNPTSGNVTAFAMAANSTGLGEKVISLPSTTTSMSSFYGSVPFEDMTMTSGSAYYKSVGASNYVRINVNAYQLPIGGA